MITSIKINSFWKLISAIVFCEIIGITSALIANVGNNNWFNTINKPTWNPPAFLFAPVWSIIYLLMGVSLWIIWNTDAPYFKKANALKIFYLQLFFNFCWSILFFKFHLILLALVDIIIMAATIIATMNAFATINKKATWILIPYIMWVSFATILNFTIWFMN